MKAIDLRKWNVIVTEEDFNAPLSVGNGNFAVTVDVLGTQSFYKKYLSIPLTSMSKKCLITDQATPHLTCKEYTSFSHITKYMTSLDKEPQAYERLRKYPFLFHFFRYELLDGKKELKSSDIQDAIQELDLYSGVIHSSFKYRGSLVKTKVMVDAINDVFRFEFKNTSLDAPFKIKISFPQASPTKQACTNQLDSFSYEGGILQRNTENESFLAYLDTNAKVEVKDNAIELVLPSEAFFELSILEQHSYQHNMNAYFDSIPFELKELDAYSLDSKMSDELKRRTALSFYLMKVNCMGDYPAQETGLTFNSWNSKFHLEMHPWHSLWMAYFGQIKQLEKQLDYYFTIASSSAQRASFQGYEGLRFPKMTTQYGVDSPSNIGCLLLWQEPHLILFVDTLYEVSNDTYYIEKYHPLLLGILSFLSSFVYFGQDGYYHLDKPIIPAQECFDPIQTEDPIFEVEYVRYAFSKMIRFHEILGKKVPKLWRKIASKLIPPRTLDGCYLACQDEQGEETYGKFNYDHPLVLLPYSFIVSNRLEKDKVKKSLQKVLTHYQLDEFWGWDFSVLALTALALDDPKSAFDLLLKNCPKNQYLKNGHNQQGNREDLTIYLPGNGGLLLFLGRLIKTRRESHEA